MLGDGNLDFKEEIRDGFVFMETKCSCKSESRSLK